MVYLVESYRSPWSTRPPLSLREVRTGVEARAVRLRARLVVPADEVEFWLFEGASMVEVGLAVAAVGIGGSRISEVEELALFDRSDRDPAVSRPVPVERGGVA